MIKYDSQTLPSLGAGRASFNAFKKNHATSTDALCIAKYPKFKYIYIYGASRRGICQIFQTNEFPNFFNFTRDRCISGNIFGQKLVMDDVLLSYF